jgi:hypothetical protein
MHVRSFGVALLVAKGCTPLLATLAASSSFIPALCLNCAATALDRS